eukprot:14291560-Alexandrium_andersonii.AAC.1
MAPVAQRQQSPNPSPRGKPRLCMITRIAGCAPCSASRPPVRLARLGATERRGSVPLQRVRRITSHG